jgi:predicted DNA-binding transcriptional regulator YafY
MLALLSLLQTRRDWPGQVLAERLDVTPRTVRRDVDRLRELGYRIAAVKGPYGGYRLAAGSELPPLLFDDEQAVAIAIALQGAAASGVDLGEAAERALATVRQVMPSRLRHRIDGIRFSGSESRHPVDPAVLEAVSEAVQHRATLRFDYRSETGGGAGSATTPAPRRTHPHELVSRSGLWYLIAWDLDRDDWRIFRLDRLTPRTPTGPAFPPRALPGGDARSFLAARFKGSELDDRWPCVGEVVLRLPAREVAAWVGDDGEVDALPDGSTRVRVGSWSWMGLLASVARFDAPFRIVGPPELLDAAARLAERVSESTIEDLTPP